MYAIRSYYDKQDEVMIPFNEDFLTRFDEKARELEMQCPEGLFDL